MKKKLIITFSFFMLSGISYGQEILVLTEDYKPFQYKDEKGQLVGFGLDLITLMFKDAGINMKGGKIYLYPWARAYKVLQEEKNTAVFMTVRSEKRENLFKWVGPLAPRKMWLFKLRKRKDIQVKTLEDAKRYRVGGYKSSADTVYMIELGLKPYLVPHQHLITRMLVKGRFDLMSSLELTMSDRLRDLGLPYDIVEKTILLDGRYDYYLALNKQTSDVIVNRLQASLDKIKKYSTYDQLKNKYLTK